MSDEKSTYDGAKLPYDFEYKGWSKANNFLMGESGITDKQEFIKERFIRSSQVLRAWQKTPEGREAASIKHKEVWRQRALAAKEQSDTAEVLLLEKIVEKDRNGVTTAAMVAGCINVIARELSKRGVTQVSELPLKDLVLISNSLLALTKAAANVKKDENWHPQVQVNNVMVNNSSKTGGVVGGIQDVIDVSTTKTPHSEKEAEA